MSDSPEEMQGHGEPEKKSYVNYVGIGLLVCAYLVSVVNTFRIQTEDSDKSIPTIRICHWQLEMGVRDALNGMADEYVKQFKERTGKDIRFVQNPITERAYRQYVTTQCIGGTAPDLIQWGSKLDMRFMSRYFKSLAEVVKKPNPYNEGTPLEGVPWIDTFNDGLNSALDQDTVDYLGVGLSAFTQRLFFNKTILREATGSDKAPDSYAEFLETCERLKEWAAENNRDDFVPVAGGEYQIDQFLGKYTSAVTLRFAFEKDMNYDARASKVETLLAYMEGRHSLSDPSFKSLNEMIANTTQYFPKGFVQLKREGAGFLFEQGKAAFIASGSWDAMSLINKVDFEVSVMGLPIPSQDDPDYGHMASGATKEELGTGFLLGLTRFYETPIPGWEDVPGFPKGEVKKIDVTLDFLYFLTTKANNQKFNRECKLIPVIKGAKPLPALQAFMPEKDGYWGADPTKMGSNSLKLYEQRRSEYLEGRRDFEQMIDLMEKDLPDRIAGDIKTMKRENKERDYASRFYNGKFYARALFEPIDTSKEKNPQAAAEAQAKNKLDAEKKLAYFWERRVGQIMGRFNFQKMLEKALSTEDKVGAERVKKIKREMKR